MSAADADSADERECAAECAVTSRKLQDKCKCEYKDSTPRRKGAKAQRLRQKALGTPCSILEDDAIAIGIFEGFALFIPIRIEGLNGLEAVLNHAVNSGLPFGCIGQVEDNQVILGRGASSGVTVFDRELEVVRRVRMTEYDAIETFVIFK